MHGRRIQKQFESKDCPNMISPRLQKKRFSQIFSKIAEGALLQKKVFTKNYSLFLKIAVV